MNPVMIPFECKISFLCSQSRSQQQRQWEGLTEGKRSGAEVTRVQQLSKSKPDVCNLKYSGGTEVCTCVDSVVGRNWIIHLCKSTQRPCNYLTCASGKNCCFCSC